jgi:hypothetical protein
MFAYREWELRMYESYDTVVTVKNFRGAETEDRMGITSIGYRYPIAPAIHAGLLIGAAWVRRPDYGIVDTELAFVGEERRTQHGLGAVIGFGFRKSLTGPVSLSVDARSYLLSWYSLGGTRRNEVNGMAVSMPVTETLGGVPVTVSVGLSWDVF